MRARGLIYGLIVVAVALEAWAQEPPAPADAGATSTIEAEAPAPPPSLPPGMLTPIDRVNASPQGTLKNTYSYDDAAVAAEGEKIYFKYGCNGCHGGNGGGGICPPLINDTWVYNGDDDTLFRLVTLGSIELQAKGYARHGHENVVAPMPPFGGIIQSDDDLWKVFAFMRSHYDGSPARKFGTSEADKAAAAAAEEAATGEASAAEPSAAEPSVAEPSVAEPPATGAPAPATPGEVPAAADAATATDAPASAPAAPEPH